jgi:hypothetical protein
MEQHLAAAGVRRFRGQKQAVRDALSEGNLWKMAINLTSGRLPEGK